jgi:hypothetical protein
MTKEELKLQCKMWVNANLNKITLNKLARDVKDFLIEETKEFPDKISLPQRVYAIALEDKCECKCCGKVHGRYDKDYCSHECYIKMKKANVFSEEENIAKKINKAIDKGNETFKNAVENDDYLVCKICGCKTGNIVLHVKMHNISLVDYKEKYNVTQVKTSKQIEKVTGANNPAYQHGGKYSPFSEKFIHADKVDRKELVERSIRNRSEQGNSTTSIEYWLKKTDGDLIEAEKLLSERQSTFSLDICIEKHGELEGTKVWKERQIKWQDTLKSKTDEELESINKKKSNQMSFQSLWSNNAQGAGQLYVLDIGSNKIKIGITSHNIDKRYKSKIFNIIKLYDADITYCFRVEQILKRVLKDSSISKEDAVDDFGWTETFEDSCLDTIIEKCDNYFSDVKLITEDFISICNVKHKDKFTF